jgi:hypothetical protein
MPKSTRTPHPASHLLPGGTIVNQPRGGGNVYGAGSGILVSGQQATLFNTGTIRSGTP